MRDNFTLLSLDGTAMQEVEPLHKTVEMKREPGDQSTFLMKKNTPS